MHSLLLVAADFDVNIVAELLKQGPLIGALAFIAFTLHKKQNETEKKVDTLRDKHEVDMQHANSKLEDYIREDREQVLTALNNNTAAWMDFKKAMEKK